MMAPAQTGDTLSPHAAVTISHIIIEGNAVTRRAVILREIDLAEGDNILTDSIPQLTNKIRLRLFNLQLFNEIDQHVAIDNDGGIDWYITVKERWFIIPTLTIQYADRNFNTWLVKENHDLHRITGGITLTDKNFRGNLEQLGVTVQAGYSQGLGISYLRPYIDKKQTSGIGFWAHYIQGSQTYYTTDSNKLLYAGTYSGPVIWHQFDGGINYVYRPAYASKHLFRLGYKSFHVEDTIVKLNSDYFASKSTNARFLELSYRYEYNGVDNWNYSLVGEKLIASAALRQGFEGINTQALAKIEAGIFRSPAPTWYWSAILRLRAMAPGDQPYYFKTALGTQTDYVRGYEYYTIDGTNYGIVRLDLKKELFNNTYSFPVKYFTAIPLRIYPKIFADAGYVQNPEPGNSFLNNRLLYSAGFGLDIVTLYDIKIRIEVAWNHLGQNGLYLHFNSE
jgi:outer membrane protein assembly factor BamA